MFRLDTDHLQLHFTIGDRDLAVAFAQMEGYEVRRWDRNPGKPLPVAFGYSSTRDGHDPEWQGAAPEQIRPGIYAYRIAKIDRRSDIERQVLDLVRQRPGERAAVYAELLHAPVDDVVGLLRRLRGQGLLERGYTRKPVGGDRHPIWAPVGWTSEAPPESGVRFTGQRSRDALSPG